MAMTSHARSSAPKLQSACGLRHSTNVTATRSRRLHSGSLRMRDSPDAKERSPAPGKIQPRPPLYTLHHTFTHGGTYWRDNYLLEQWDRSQQPVVYLGQTYGGYELRRRLGNWCWLTKDPRSGAHMTVKFLSRSSRRELPMAQFVQKHSQSPYLSIIHDHFRIPHHLDKAFPWYSGIEFDAIVYPTTGTDLRRLSTPGEHIERPDLPLTLARRKRCIQDLIRGLVELHDIGVVHGDIHPGNLALPPPSGAEVEDYLIRNPPRTDEVRRMDGYPTRPTLPTRVTEPVDLGFGEGVAKIIDLGFAFRPGEGGQYGSDCFPTGTPLPPELLDKGATTTLPFKVDSWHLGICILFIITNGRRLLQGAFGSCTYDIDHYREEMSALENRVYDEMEEFIPAEFRDGFRPVLLALLREYPAHRSSVHELLENDWLMKEDAD